MRSVKLVSAVAALALVGTLGLAGCGSKDASNGRGDNHRLQRLWRQGRCRHRCRRHRHGQ